MTNGQTNLHTLLQSMQPKLNKGEYVFCTSNNIHDIDVQEIQCLFKEAEGYTVILKKETADKLQLPYNYVAAWITLTVHSSLEAVGLTAAFSKALAEAGISCNVVAAFYHDHIFVNVTAADNALAVLKALAGNA